MKQLINYYSRKEWKRHPRSATKRYSEQLNSTGACGGGDTPKYKSQCYCQIGFYRLVSFILVVYS